MCGRIRSCSNLKDCLGISLNELRKKIIFLRVISTWAEIRSQRFATVSTVKYELFELAIFKYWLL